MATKTADLHFAIPNRAKTSKHGNFLKGMVTATDPIVTAYVWHGSNVANHPTLEDRILEAIGKHPDIDNFGLVKLLGEPLSIIFPECQRLVSEGKLRQCEIKIDE